MWLESPLLSRDDLDCFVFAVFVTCDNSRETKQSPAGMGLGHSNPFLSAAPSRVMGLCPRT